MVRGFNDKAAFGAGPAWFCIRAQLRHEHIAAAQLKMEEGIEVYLPRIRFKRSTRRGPVWFTEALFPNYLFARFEFGACARKLHHARGVHGIVHFGKQWPAIPDGVISELRRTIGAEQVHVMESQLEPGETVHVSGGAFHGLQAVVTRVMPAATERDDSARIPWDAKQWSSWRARRCCGMATDGGEFSERCRLSKPARSPIISK